MLASYLCVFYKCRCEEHNFAKVRVHRCGPLRCDLIEESPREGGPPSPRTLPKEELENLHISVGINHGMVEDPAMFLVLGLNGF